MVIQMSKSVVSELTQYFIKRYEEEKSSGGTERARKELE